ncbi:hypothetical protein GUITHDRAFT_62023, partial [Guillardia theta CCMP2712]
VEVAGRSVRIGPVIAEGGYSFVHVAYDMLERRRTLALKRIVCHERDDVARAIEEIELLKTLPLHPNIVRYRSSAQRKIALPGGVIATEVLLLTDFYPGGGLQDVMNRLREEGQVLSEQALLLLFGQVCNAVAHLHSQSPPIAHRDVKLENVLLHGEMDASSPGRVRLVLCDFGSATTRAQVYETRKDILEEEERIQKFTTLAYRAPEMVDLYQRKRIDERVDVWALGVLLYNMCFNKFPFDPQSPLSILSGRFSFPTGKGGDQMYSAALLDVISRCLLVDPDVRPSVFEVLDQVRKL